MGLFDFIGKTQAVFENKEISQEKFSKAKEYAQLKKLKEAIKLAEEIKSLWKENPSWREQLVRDVVITDLLYNVNSQLTTWKMRLQRGESFASQGKEFIALDKNDPFDSTILTQALDSFTKCNELLYETEYVVNEQILKDKIKRRNQFQSLYNEGKNQGKKGFYREGLTYLLEAEKIYKVVTVAKKIKEYENLAQLQTQYENNLKQIKNLAQQGNFILAKSQLQLNLEKFSRQDGEELKQKLETVINAKTEYRQGLLAEKIGNFTIAKKQYQLALSHLHSFDLARYRLALIYIKENDYNSALSCLAKMTGERSNYLRGFCYLQKNEWENTAKEWKQINHDLVDKQKESLKILIQRNRLQIIQHIENLVADKNYEEAKNCCQNLTEKYGYNENIEHNLSKHIQPALESQLWQSNDLVNIINQLSEEFKNTPNITILHNMTIALYYQVQIDASYTEKWIAVWATGLVNIKQNPILQNLPWLSINQIDYEKIKEELIKIVENIIDKYKDSNLQKYYQLRDIFRREMLAIELIGNPPSSGVKIRELFITPAFYQQHKSQLKNINLTINQLGTLFTDWGLTVAACLKNDVERGIKIKPNLTPSSDIEKLAYSLINYYQGCYYLQQDSWKKAVSCLKIAQNEIKNNCDWLTEIDSLCQKQRQKIENFNEHLEFAQFWYNLLKSSSSASYLAEFKAREISDKVANEKISFSQAISQLKEVQKIDQNNPLILDLLSRLKYSKEAEEVDQLLKQNRFEDAVKKAKHSSNQEIKYLVASIFIEIALNGAKTKELDWETLQQLGRWAYDICPYEPDFRELYKALHII
ncbi:MAG: peptidase M, neutral zinc metallopeptidase, zinc-binding site [Cyanobacteria bacterium]|nr:peptidase M, neutral zinc metallopeptidase, zinc-binding site [Cyanobacteria bacterium CG_2015-16_32_12]NCO78940.1 peptidase M, neutral zinc metallopeptidase, zinc-binding site [Cyanobacteria bacterium CG_2015-22_32_23]NCQ04961.1 peptidase M, neutral zinc metallopeptidase, zinc-binding site [Cyanobacteria bacterium CG_2015-09_32_10]NCS83813.1 peptidase M, neutral zinc metallopeptidase, zinc-binding site [Cyanobacteria bacterium CG_2015-02_32_10]